MKAPWTRTQDVLLRKLWAYAEMRNMVWTLHKTEAAIRNRAHNLGLHGRYANRKPYSAAEKRRLRKLFPRMSSFKVAKRMKRSVCSVNGMATKFGLHKTAKYLASPDACRLRRGDNVGEPFRFRPGHVPANKGLRRPGYAPGRMAETQFKKGQRTGAANSNWRPIGTVVFNADGYLIRKIADEPHAGVGATNRNWEFVHKRVWEDAHGPIPKGYRIWWKDGNHANCALENLELVSEKDSMLRKSIHRLPPELKDTIMLAGRLKRIIRRKTKEAIEEGLRGARHQGAAETSV